MRFIVENLKTRVVTDGDDYVRCPDFNKELKEFLSVKVPGSFFIQKKMREMGKKFKWDGVHNFMNNSGEFATGFLPVLFKTFIPHYDLEVEFDDRRTNLPEFKDSYDFSTPEFDLAPHQQRLVKSVNNCIEYKGQRLYFPRGMWKAATNSGKTASFYGVLNNMVDPCAVLVVDTTQLFEQHVDYYRSVLGDVGMVGNYKGKSYNKTGKTLTIVMVQTFANRLKKDLTLAAWFLNKVNVLAYDECHTSAVATAGTSIAQAANAGCILGMSGTPLDMSDEMKAYKLTGITGGVLCSIRKAELMDIGFSLRPVIKMYHNSAKTVAADYGDEFSKVITTSAHRAELIADIIAEHADKQIIVTFFERKHGQLMMDILLEKYSLEFNTGNVDWVHGEHKDRSDRLDRFRDGTTRVLFGSSILTQGINIKEIEVIIFAQGEKAEVALSQWGGRGERRNGDATTYTWVDIYDEGEWVSKHSRDRIRYYKKEGFDINYQYNADKRGIPKKQ
ncbi:MAG: DEAD/DEAH box helicase family protein [Chitinophagales bacterium]|nr:DEAD/DEAH box helicase family protein [Chitinophagales bacterium]